MKATVDVLETKAEGDVVGTASKTREQVIDEVTTRWQELADVFAEPTQRKWLDTGAEISGLNTWWNSYQAAKSALEKFGATSPEYREARREFRHITGYVIYLTNAEEARLQNEPDPFPVSQEVIDRLNSE